METFAQAANPSPAQNPSPKSKLKYFLFAVVFVILAAIVIGLVVFLSPKDKYPSAVIARVGEENIYKKDLDFEMSKLPPQAKVDQKVIIDKMVTDSVILQSGQKMNLISLDNSIFNNPDKDYLKRIAAVKDVSDKVKGEVTHIKGTAILLFFQNGFVGPLGYDKAKEITLGKITRIHKDVADKKITAQQAAGQIINDTSLKQIDESYKSNAGFSFDVEKGQDPTQVKVLNDLLWQLPENSVTDIFTDTGRNISDKNTVPDDNETYYIFAVLDKKIMNENFAGYEDWLAKQKNSYEVIHY